MANKERRDPNMYPDPNREKQNPQWKPGDETTKTGDRENTEER